MSRLLCYLFVVTFCLSFIETTSADQEVPILNIAFTKDKPNGDGRGYDKTHSGYDTETRSYHIKLANNFSRKPTSAEMRMYCRAQAYAPGTTYEITYPRDGYVEYKFTRTSDATRYNAYFTSEIWCPTSILTNL